MEAENSAENRVQGVAAEEVAAVEVGPVGNEMPKGDIVLGDKPKKKTGVILGMILLFLLAAGGIGFGVWAWMDGNAQKDDLNAQIDTLKEQNNKLLEQIGEEGEDIIIDVDTDTDTNTDADANSSVNTEDYIYIGEWGIKIKKPENWRSLVGEYSFHNGYPQSIDSLQIKAKGAWTGGVNIFVLNKSCEEQVSYNACFMLDGMAVTVNELAGEYDVTSDEFKNYFINPENYSKI